MREEINGFQPIGFSFAVVSVEYVKTASTDYFSLKISKSVGFDFSKKHRRIVAQRATVLRHERRVQVAAKKVLPFIDSTRLIHSLIR